MKILYINSREPDYLQDLTYHGLTSVIGSANVVHVPLNWNYHFPFRKYPRNLGVVRGSLTKRILTSNDINSMDMVIVGSARPDCFLQYLEIVDNIPLKMPVLFLDGGDSAEVGGDLTRLEAPELYQNAIAKRRFDLVLKREMLIDKEYQSNVIPFPLSINFDLMSDIVRTSFRYDVSFWGIESDPIRSNALALLEDRFDCRKNGTTKNQLFKKYKRKGMHYLRELQRCRIVLNFKGVGWDTLRYWEVPALGTFLISQRPRIVIPDNFEHEKEVIFCKDDLSDLLDLCAYYLKQDSKRESIALAAYGKAKQFHSTEARANYLLREANKFTN